jgi:F-type H+-transporting ATPase subunit delta
MNEGRIAVRYAKALFEVATEKSVLEEVKNDISFMENVYKLTPEFDLFLSNPSLTKSERIEWLEKLMPGAHSVTLAFVRQLVEQRRENKIPIILRYFMDLYREHAGFKKVKVITAVPLGAESQNTLQSKLESNLKAKVEFENETDASILGGIILQVDDLQFDASVASGLSRLRNKLLSSEQV